jgi:hypothetical protein
MLLALVLASLLGGGTAPRDLAITAGVTLALMPPITLLASVGRG